MFGCVYKTERAVVNLPMHHEHTSFWVCSSCFRSVTTWLWVFSLYAPNLLFRSRLRHKRGCCCCCCCRITTTTTSIQAWFSLTHQICDRLLFLTDFEDFLRKMKNVFSDSLDIFVLFLFSASCLEVTRNKCVIQHAFCSFSPTF